MDWTPQEIECLLAFVLTTVVPPLLTFLSLACAIQASAPLNSDRDELPAECKRRGQTIRPKFRDI